MHATAGPCSLGPFTDAILFAPRNSCPVGRSGHAITIGLMLRLLDHGAASCLDLDLVRGVCPGCGATYWHGRDGHEDETTGYWTCGADGCPGAMPADWPGPACGGRVAWVPVSDDLDADAYRAAVAGGVL